jgi:excisionase family DNA binding protein
VTAATASHHRPSTVRAVPVPAYRQPPAPIPHRRTAATRLLTPGEVAVMFRVDPRTVTRWATEGRLRYIRTLGGHRRFLESEVAALLSDESGPGPAHRV